MMPRTLTTLAAVSRLSTDMKYGDDCHMNTNTATKTRSNPCPWIRSTIFRLLASCASRTAAASSSWAVVEATAAR
jgi:hypothetical protein